MTNFEKYKEEIKEAFKENGTCGVRQIIDRKNDLTSMSCFGCPEYMLEWLISEYKAPEVDWSKVEVDTPILVRDDGTLWSKRHFARYEDGKVFYFYGGATSWSNNGFMHSCQYAKLAEEEEEEEDTLEANSVRHGHWNRRYYLKADGSGFEMFWCSSCREEFSYDAETGISITDSNYCPNCGAKMDEEVKE